jgi:hypothetical protein
MRVSVSVLAIRRNCIRDESSTHADVTVFIQNKQVNSHQNSGKHFMGHSEEEMRDFVGKQISDSHSGKCQGGCLLECCAM